MRCVCDCRTLARERPSNGGVGLGELLGGEDRIDKTLFESCGDSLIVNLGSEEWVNVCR